MDVAPRLGGAATPPRELALVATLYALVSFALVGPLRFGWDETVYISQVARHIPAAFFSAPRARGITWLAAPIVTFTTNTWAVRAYLAIAAAVALVAAFWPWLRINGRRAVAAAGVFAVLWPTLFYAPQAMPNLWVAFCAIGAVGWFVRATREPGSRRALLGVAGWLAAATIIRPSDGSWLALPLIAAAVVVPAWRRVALAATTIGALVVGWVPWLIESFVTYGGPFARLSRASAIEGGHIRGSTL